MRSYVADTSVASLILRKRPEVSAYREHLEGARIYLNFQTIAEMRFGAVEKLGRVTLEDIGSLSRDLHHSGVYR